MKKDSTDIRKALLTAVMTSFEGMVFEEVEAAQNNNVDKEFKSKVYLFYIPLLKPFTGTFLMAVPEETAQSITATVHAISDKKIPKNTILDTLKEILNTASGCFMREYLGFSEDFSIGLATAKWDTVPVSKNSLAKMYIDLDGKTLLVEVIEGE